MYSEFKRNCSFSTFLLTSCRRGNAAVYQINIWLFLHQNKSWSFWDGWIIVVLFAFHIHRMCITCTEFSFSLLQDVEFKTMPNIKQCQRWIQSRKRRLLTYHIITTQVKTLGPHLHHTSYQHLRQMNIKANWKVCSTTCNEDTFPKPFLKIFDLIHVPELCCRASVLPNQFLGKGHAGLFATPLPAVVMTGIWNLVMVLAIACLLFAKDTGIFDVSQRMMADWTPVQCPSKGWHTHSWSTLPMKHGDDSFWKWKFM